jgi:hypothetical protein
MKNLVATIHIMEDIANQGIYSKTFDFYCDCPECEAVYENEELLSKIIYNICKNLEKKNVK